MATWIYEQEAGTGLTYDNPNVYDAIVDVLSGNTLTYDTEGIPSNYSYQNESAQSTYTYPVKTLTVGFFNALNFPFLQAQPFADPIDNSLTQWTYPTEN